MIAVLEMATVGEVGTKQLRITVAGATGSIARHVVARVCAARDLRLVGALERPGHPELGRPLSAESGRATTVRLTDDPERALVDADVTVDFGAYEHPATADILRVAAARGVAYFVSPTRLDNDARAALDHAATRIPIVADAN